MSIFFSADLLSVGWWGIFPCCWCW